MNNLTIEEQNIIYDLARYKQSWTTIGTEITGKEVTLPYHNNVYDVRIASHLGQRKLFMAEVEFLSDYGHLSYDIVYTGCSQANHIFYLAKLFPEHNFYVYHHDINYELNTNERIKIINNIFTEKDANDWKDKKILFLSDIRDFSSIKGGYINRKKDDLKNDTNEAVEKDLLTQAKWISIMNPEASMIKFHPPYGPGKFRYLSGVVYSQCWAPKTSSEARLVILKNSKNNYEGEKDINEEINGLSLEMRNELINKGYEITIYDNKKWEDTFFYVNTILREWVRYYNPYFNKSVGMCNCYDCCIEAKIWNKYLKTKDEGDKDDIAYLINETNLNLSSRMSLTNIPHGIYPEDTLIYQNKNGVWKDKRKKIIEKYGELITESTMNKLKYYKNKKCDKYFS